MKKQILVVGLGRFGQTIASTLSSIGHEVLAIDEDEALVQQAASEVTHAVQVNATNEAALRELGINNFDIGIVTIPVIETSVLSTILLKKLGVKYIIARAGNDLHETILEKIGVDKVVYPEREMGSAIAYVLTLGNVIDYIPVTTEYGVSKMSVQPFFVGKSLSELGFGHRGAWQIIVLLLQRKNEILVNPSVTEEIRHGDVLIVSGNVDKLEELFAHLQKTISAEKED